MEKRDFCEDETLKCQQHPHFLGKPSRRTNLFCLFLCINSPLPIPVVLPGMLSCSIRGGDIHVPVALGAPSAGVELWRVEMGAQSPAELQSLAWKTLQKFPLWTKLLLTNRKTI